jgi:MFS family permease
MISQFGDRLNQMALIALVASKSRHFVPDISKLFFFMLLPACLFGPVAGVCIDRWNRRKTLIVTDLLRSVLVVSIPLLAISQWMWPIYTVVFLVFLLTRFFIPAKMAIIPGVVKRDEIFMANSLSTVAAMVAAITGMTLGGLLISWVGVETAFWIDGGTYIVSAIFLWMIGTQNPTKREEKVKIKRFLEEMKRGLMYLHSHSRIYMYIIALGMLMVSGGFVAILAIAFLRTCLIEAGANADHFIRYLGFLGGSLGLGMLGGIVISGKYGSRFGGNLEMSIGLPFVLLGACIYMMTQLRSIPLIAIFALIGGIFAPSILIFINSSIHRSVPELIQGRTFSMMDIVTNLTLLSSVIVAGCLGNWLGEKLLLQLVGGGVVVFGIAMCLWRRITK